MEKLILAIINSIINKYFLSECVAVIAAGISSQEAVKPFKKVLITGKEKSDN